MKRVLLLILVLTIFLVSCFGSVEERLKKKFNKTLDKYVGYETELEIKICGERESLYKLQENYINDDKIKIEVLEPKENNNIIIEYKDDNIYLKNTSINESIALKEVKEINRGLLYGEIFTNRKDIISMKEEKIKDKDYYIVETDFEDHNNYNKKKFIYLNKKNFIPEMMVISNKSHKKRVIIKYNKFKYIRK